ncbi:MAG: hypothetical protein M0038_16665 [Pseudomonadota bacterium]|nr:hypothetical protein [Pseudomonadota bacterium]
MNASYTGPRNRVAFERGQRAREAIRQLLLEYSQRYPLGRSLTAWEIQAHLRPLGIRLATSTIYWHLEQIRAEVDEPLEGCNFSNSSTAGEAAR